jgi:hypothetical protein
MLLYTNTLRNGLLLFISNNIIRSRTNPFCHVPQSGRLILDRCKMLIKSWIVGKIHGHQIFQSITKLLMIQRLSLMDSTWNAENGSSWIDFARPKTSVRIWCINGATSTRQFVIAASQNRQWSILSNDHKIVLGWFTDTTRSYTWDLDVDLWTLWRHAAQFMFSSIYVIRIKKPRPLNKIFMPHLHSRSKCFNL